MDITNVSLNMQISGLVTKTVTNWTPSAKFSVSRSPSLADGTSDNQVNQVWSTTGNLTPSATTTIDLAGGITDLYGDTVTFAAIKAIIIKNTTTTDADGTDPLVRIGAAAGTVWNPVFQATSDTVDLPPYGAIMLTAPIDGWPVSDGTSDYLKLANQDADGTASYEIGILGVV